MNARRVRQVKKTEKLSLQTSIKQGESLYERVTAKVFRDEIPSHNLYDPEFQLQYQKWLENIRINVLPRYQEIYAGLFNKERFDIVGNYISDSSSPEARTAYRLFLEIFLQQLDVLRKNSAKAKIELKNTKIKFDDSLPAVAIDGELCLLPPSKNEHDLCCVMFKYKKGKAIDWSEVFEKITGNKVVIGEKKDMRMIQDTSYAINRRIKKCVNTADDLFSWGRKTITRNF
jgi:hypothetical protein